MMVIKLLLYLQQEKAIEYMIRYEMNELLRSDDNLEKEYLYENCLDHINDYYELKTIYGFDINCSIYIDQDIDCNINIYKKVDQILIKTIQEWKQQINIMKKCENQTEKNEWIKKCILKIDPELENVSLLMIKLQ